ncbi:MAG: hypothetical protein E8D43_01425 [Nitrospira sp.]|nr:MAG: hypothetical protein E8D43_01425 [Nitrospira sp.]
MPKLAVLDIGTNSIHMVLAEVQPDYTYKILDRFKDMTRLGDGVFTSRRLSDQAMMRGLEVIRNLVTLARNKGYERIEGVATSAVREARNGRTDRLADAGAVETRHHPIENHQIGTLCTDGGQSGDSIVGFDDPIAQPFQPPGHTDTGNLIVVDEEDDRRRLGGLPGKRFIHDPMRWLSHVCCS